MFNFCSFFWGISHDEPTLNNVIKMCMCCAIRYTLRNSVTHLDNSFHLDKCVIVLFLECHFFIVWIISWIWLPEREFRCHLSHFTKSHNIIPFNVNESLPFDVRRNKCSSALLRTVFREREMRSLILVSIQSLLLENAP